VDRLGKAMRAKYNSDVSRNSDFDHHPSGTIIMAKTTAACICKPVLKVFVFEIFIWSAGTAADNLVHVNNERYFAGMENLAAGVVQRPDVQVIGARRYCFLRGKPEYNP
jgi:hypothetical protein